MIIAIDIETRGLDATKFVMGCIAKEKQKKTKTYHNKEKMWEDIIKLGLKEEKRKKMLNVYAHNMAYDFYGIANLKDKNIRWHSHRPFIASYTHKGKEIIKFLDTWAIYRMPLKKLGEMINLPKLEMPKELKEYTNKDNKEKIQTYMERDAQICLKSIEILKEKLKQNGNTTKRLYTINQIAINNLINHWRKNRQYHHVFWNEKTGETRRTLREEEIHAAYRGGRVECFKTGKHEKTTHIDCNSLYPYIATRMAFPDLRTERKKGNPPRLAIYSAGLIGISRAMIKNKTNKIGLLPIRTKTGNYYPKEGQTMIGTWTNEEIRTAIKEGYELIDIEWMVTWQRARNNPLKKYMKDLYRQRMKEENEYDKYIYKSLMNCCLGKLAQRRTEQEILLDSVEKAEEYKKHLYEVINGIGYNYLYKSNNENTKRKKYYTPIIPTLINAKARIYMYYKMKKIGKDNLIYTDTDSIIYTRQRNQKRRQDRKMIGKEMGKFKTEHENATIHMISKKTYMIGEEIKISGIKKKDANKEDFEKGRAKETRMITINTAENIEEAGTFKTTERDLNKQKEEAQRTKEMLEEEPLLIDADIHNINYFLKRKERFK